MTSAIAGNPFFAVAEATGPITKKVVEKAVASASEGFKVTPDRIYRDLQEIVSTKAFGEKTPELAPDVVEHIASLVPAEKASGYNNMAAAFATVLTKPPAPGQIYAQAHKLQGLVTGAVVALQAELAEKTPEQKADKNALVGAFQEHIVDTGALETFAGLWAAFAQPAGEGTFEVPRDVSGAITASITSGDMTPELKQILQAKLALGELKSESAEAAEAKKAKFENERTRPIGGKSDAELEVIYKAASDGAKIQRIVHRPERFRTAKYQKILNALNDSPITEILKPIIKEIIARHNVETRRMQKAQLTEISKENAAQVDDVQLQAVRKTAMKVADRIGAGDPSVARIASSTLNAWVSSVDTDNPHITYFSHLQDIFWDHETGDWLKFHVDANDNFCEPGAPGAREISGEDGVAGVFAHELTHITEQAVANQYLLAILLGVNLKDPSVQFGEGCLCQNCATGLDRADLADKLMHDPRIAGLVNGADFKEAQLQLADTLDIKSSLLAAKAAPADADAQGKAKAARSGVMGLFLMTTREGESTADYGMIRAMGPNTPRWLAITFDLVSRGTGQGSSKAKLEALKASYKRDHKANMESKLSYSEEGGATSHAGIAQGTTHPTHILRVIGNYDYAEKSSTKQVWAFENRPVRLRILGAAQAVDSEIERLEDQHAEFVHGSADHMVPEEVMKTLERAHNRKAIASEQERMRVVTSQIAKLVFDDGLPGTTEYTAYAIHVAAFMKSGGDPLFRPKTDANPLAALLGGGGGGPAPTCVKMATQLADELEKILDAAKLPENLRAQWGVVVDTYRKLADEGGDKVASSRMMRTQGKSLTRSLRAS